MAVRGRFPLEWRVPDSLLRAAVTAARGVSPDRTFPLDHDGRRLWVKQAAPALHPLVHVLQSAAALALALPVLRPPRRRLPAAVLADEAAALRMFARAGLPVPTVVAHWDDALVLDDGGHKLEGLLGPADAEVRRAMVVAAAHLLLRVHRAGLWHGGAQIRNFTWSEGTWSGGTWADGAPGLLDLEDQAGLVHLPLPVRHARDVLLFLYSVIRYGDAVMAPAAAILLGGSAAPVRTELARARARLAGPIRLLRPVLPRLGRDGRQVLAAYTAIAHALDSRNAAG
jgi:hypothetical protein